VCQMFSSTFEEGANNPCQSDAKFNWKDIRVTISGATGMIGRYLTQILLKEGARIRAISLDKPESGIFTSDVEFIRADLRNFDACLAATKHAEVVFHLAGIKGSPLMTKMKPASFFTNTISFNTNMMEASRRNSVGRYLFTSSIGVYEPCEILKEDDVWRSFPSENDRFAGYAKRMGELQADAMRIEYGWKDIKIVRPANVFGQWDNFDPENAMVIPSLISRIANGENPLKIWGDGSAERDFIHAEDVALAMLHIMNSDESRPVNIGSGEGLSIRQLAGIFSSFIPNLEVTWDLTKPAGDKKRVMDVSRLKALGFKPKRSLDEAIEATYKWYLENVGFGTQRYNAFTEQL
jgi:GDP-L-fucose synthase